MEADALAQPFDMLSIDSTDRVAVAPDPMGDDSMPRAAASFASTDVEDLVFVEETPVRENAEEEDTMPVDGESNDGDSRPSTSARSGGPARFMIRHIHVSEVDTVFSRAEAAMKDVSIEDIFTLDPEEVLWEAKHKKSLKLIHFFNQPSTMETLLASLQNDNKPFVLCEMLERKRTSESAEEREAIDCKIKAAHISGELLVAEAQQGGFFNEENVQRIFSFLFSFVFVPESDSVLPAQIYTIIETFIARAPNKVIDYLLTQDSCHFVDCIINRLHQDGMLCFLRSFVWLLSPYSAKSKEEPTEPRIMAADTFHQWLETGRFVVKVLEALVERPSSAVWTHSIQLLIDLTLISLRHLAGNLRPLKAVEEVIASPWLRQFFTLTFSLSSEDDYVPGIFLMSKLLKHEAVKFKARRGTNNSTTTGSAEGDQRRELDAVPSPLARYTAAHIDHIADILRGPADAGKSSRLGFPRMRTLEALNAFVSLLASHVIFQSDFFVLCSLPLWNAVLDLFFGFVCNNIAQNIIQSTIVTLFNTTGPVQVKLLILQDAGLLKRIVEANAGNEEDIRNKAGRRGYMGAITQIASALVNCATNEEDVRLAMQDNHEWNAYVMGTLAATCELQESINECYQPPEKNPASLAAAIASRGLMKAARLADNATAVNGMSRKPIVTSAAAAKPSAAPTARASSAIAEAIRKAREEKRANARAAGGRAKHGFRRGTRDRSSSFPEVELFIPVSMTSTETSAADNTGPSGEAEQAGCQVDNVAVEGEVNGTRSDEKENAKDHQCLNGQSSV